jgi:NADH:ubiquinone oxidoreductase subunit 5 (subunit L)/multisubunit Na+/H+ antiporter MnhA subunit
MLAYCTIENIGIIGIGIGIGLMGIGNGTPIMYYLGFGGALLHVLNHSLFKSLLFYSAGSVYQQTHTRDMEKLGGLIKVMPKTAFLFLIGSVAIGGIPPFNGFVSEFILYSGLVEGIKSNDLSQISLLILSFAGLSIIGGVSVLTFTKTFGTIFLGSPRETLKHKPVEVSRTMLIPQYIIIAVMLSVVFIPKFYLGIIGNLLAGMSPVSSGMDLTVFTSYASTISYISIASACLIALIAFIWITRRLATSKLPSVKDATWGCGYVAPNTRMQYSGKSFSKPLGKIFSFFLVESKNYRELDAGEIFPKTRNYSSYYHDFFEFRLISRFTTQLVNASSLFKFIQNGKTQSYVLYGIIFILAILIITVLNVI